MNNKEIKMPEFVPEPTPVDRIVDLAIDLVDQYGLETSDDPNSEYSSAIYYVPDNEAGDGKYPSLKINIPKEKFSPDFAWRAELTFGNQDPQLSAHLLVKKDGTIEASNYTDNSAAEVLSDTQVESLEEYLKQIQPNLISDNL